MTYSPRKVCPKGHAMTEENTRISTTRWGKTTRWCATCKLARQERVAKRAREWYEKGGGKEKLKAAYDKKTKEGWLDSLWEDHRKSGLRPKEFCSHGHVMDEFNVKVESAGKGKTVRRCRACLRDKKRRRQFRRATSK